VLGNRHPYRDQPPFEAAPRQIIETDLVVAKPRLLPLAKKPPESRLKDGMRRLVSSGWHAVNCHQ
jgi:hypothetical protein